MSMILKEKKLIAINHRFCRERKKMTAIKKKKTLVQDKFWNIGNILPNWGLSFFFNHPYPHPQSKIPKLSF